MGNVNKEIKEARGNYKNSKGALSNNLVYKTPFHQPGEGNSKWHPSLAHFVLCPNEYKKKVFCMSFKCTGHGQFSGLYSAVITRRSMMGNFFSLQIHEPRNKASHDVTAAILVSQTMKRRPCWCPKPILWEWNSFLMQTLSLVSLSLQRCWPRE